MSSPLVEKRASVLEWGLGVLIAIAVQALLFLILESKADAGVRPEVREPIVMKVDTFVQRPLLKLGSKTPKKAALPQLVKKKKPAVIKRKEARAAPDEEAVDVVEEANEVELADEKHEAPKKEEETVEKLEQELLDEEPEEIPEHTEEGAEDGSEQGTEVDPQKAFIMSQYRIRVIAWFQQRFRRPTDQIECEALRKLSAGVSINIGSDRKVQGFSITSPSGNLIFDQRVTSNMGSLVGQLIPPPPPLYPEFLQSTLFPRLSGNAGPCPKKFKPTAPSQPTAAAAPEAPTTPPESTAPSSPESE